MVKVKVLEADDKGRVRLSMKAVGAPEARAKQASQQAAAQATKRGAAASLFVVRGEAYFATCFSRSSSSVLQSMHSVAVGRASRRFRPISTPQLSQ